MNHQPTTLKPAEYGRTVYSHAVAQGNTYEEVFRPEYWVHLTKFLRAGDRIEVKGPDGAYFAELYVANVNDLGVRMVELVKVAIKDNAPTEDEAVDPDYDIKLRGPKKWSIVRKADGQVIKEDMATRAVAVNELDSMRKALAA